MSNELVETKIKELISCGYTMEEAAALIVYKSNGLPGIGKLKADAFEAMYVMGYSCKDIHTQFPEYDFGMIVYAKEKYKWDEKKASYQANLAKQAHQAAALAKAEMVRFLSDVLMATHMKNRAEIMKYMANPEREKAPDFLPKGLQSYQNLVNMMSDLTEAPKPPPGAPGTNPAAAGLSLNVNVNTNGVATRPDIVVTPKAVGDALIQEMKAGKKDGHE